MTALSLVLLAVQVTYHLLLRLGWRRALDDARAFEGARAEVPVSVVVAARDESARIPALLDALSAQEHGRFEAVIVDDGSLDGTADLVRNHAARDPRVRLVPNPDPKEPRKKHALAAGIAAARHDRLVFTDADCVPGPGWLAAMASALGAQEGRGLVVGVGQPLRRPGMLNALQRWDAAWAAYTGAAAIAWRRPYLAKGSNMAYDRAVFEAVGGYASMLSSLSGDDDLLVQAVAERGAGRVRFQPDPRAIVRSPSPETLRGWVRQKRRHTAASRHYGPAIQVHLALYHGSATLLWLAPVVAGGLGFAALAARLVIVALAARDPLRRTGHADLAWKAPVLDFLHACFHASIPPIGYFFGARRW